MLLVGRLVLLDDMSLKFFVKTIELPTKLWNRGAMSLKLQNHCFLEKPNFASTIEM
jgi:hypothetical protein